MATIHKVFIGEVFKLRRTAVSWLIVLFPILVTSLFFGIYAHRASKMGSGDISKITLWIPYAENFIHFFVFFFPMLVAIIAFSLANIENKNNGWKLMYTLPVRKHYFYFSKIALLYTLLLISTGLGYVLMLGSGWALSEIYPQLNFNDMGGTAKFLSVIFLKHFVVVASIATIHFILTLCWSNFIICIGSACFLTVCGLIAMQWKYAYLLPYTNSSFVLNDLANNIITWFPQYVWIDALWILGFIIIGYFVVKYKQTK